MNISSVNASDYCGINRLAWVPGEKLNLIFGRNEAGKTTLLRIIRHALVGAGGVPPAAFIRSGQTDFELNVEIVHQGMSLKQRVSSKSSRLSRKELETALGFKLEVLESLLDLKDVLDQPAAKKKSLLWSVLGLEESEKICRDELMKALRESGHVTPEEDLQPLFDMGFKIGATFKESHKSAYDTRTVANRQATGSEALLKQMIRELKEKWGLDFEFKEWTAERKLQLAKDIERLKAEQAQLQTTHQPQREVANLLVEIGRLTAEKTRLQEEHDRLAQAVASRDTVQAEYQAALEEFNTADDQLKAAEEAVKAAKKVEQQTRTEFESLQAVIDSLALPEAKEGGEGLCVLSAKMKCDIPCRSLAEIGARQKHLLDEVGRLAKTLQTNTQFRERTEKMERVKRTEQTQKKERMDGLKVRAEAADQTATELEQYRKDLDAVVIPARPEQIAEDPQVAQRREKLALEIGQNEMLMRILAEHKTWEAAMAKYDLLDSVTRKLDKDGIPSAMILGQMDRLGNMLHEASREAFGGKWELDLKVLDEDVVVMLNSVQNATAVPLNMLSGSQRFRAKVVLNEVLSRLAKTRLLLVDGLDVLDSERREWLMQYLSGVMEHYDQGFITCTAAYELPDHGMPGAAWWTVENDERGIQLHYLRHVTDTVRVPACRPTGSKRTPWPAWSAPPKPTAPCSMPSMSGSPLTSPGRRACCCMGPPARARPA